MAAWRWPVMAASSPGGRQVRTILTDATHTAACVGGADPIAPPRAIATLILTHGHAGDPPCAAS